MAARIPAGSARRDLPSGEAQAKRTAGRGEVGRAEELHNLRLALAAFALQLDAFEMRANGALLGVGRKPAIAVPRPHRLRAPKGEDDWASIKSPGNKSDT